MNPGFTKVLGRHPKASLTVILIGLAVHFAFPRYLVATNSMEPTMPSGSYVVAFRGAYIFSKPKAGDIAVFDPVEGIASYPWIHRIKAVSEEAFSPINRKRRKDTDDVYNALTSADTFVIPNEYYYQSGDASNSYHGLVKRELIRGKVLFHFKLPWK